MNGQQNNQSKKSEYVQNASLPTGTKKRWSSVGNRRSYFGEGNPRYRHGFTVGDKPSPLYSVWAEMKNRSTNVTHKSANNYIYRGITMVAEWFDFRVFAEWAINNGYRKGLCIDRKDNDRGYGPDNCRFITNTENCRNGRNSSINVVIAKEIKHMLAEGVLTNREIALANKCSEQIVSKIKHGRSWADVEYTPPMLMLHEIGTRNRLTSESL